MFWYYHTFKNSKKTSRVFFLPTGNYHFEHFISLSFKKYLLTIVFTMDILVAVNTAHTQLLTYVPAICFRDQYQSACLYMKLIFALYVATWLLVKKMGMN